MKRILCMLLTLVMMAGLLPAAHGAEVEEHMQAAMRLYNLGLVSGTGTDANGNPNFELNRAPTRSEAITVLVKLLGKEEEASKGGWEMPFTDVPGWARNFVGYAYTNGLTAGTSATTFGGDDPVTAAQYITFVLKALGYSANGDFAWDCAWELSDKLDVTDGRYNAATANFTRGDVFLISDAALAVKLKGTEQTLAQKLIAGGVFTAEVYDALNVESVVSKLTLSEGAESLEALVQVLNTEMCTKEQAGSMLGIVRMMLVLNALEKDAANQTQGVEKLQQIIKMTMGEDLEGAARLLRRTGELAGIRMEITQTMQFPQQVVDNLGAIAESYRKELPALFQQILEENREGLTPEEEKQFMAVSEGMMQMMDACLVQFGAVDAAWQTQGKVCIGETGVSYTYEESPILIMRVDGRYYWFTN